MDTTTDTPVIATTSQIVAPDLTVVDGQVTTTSRQIAQHFGKRHGNVLRDIARIVDEVGPEFAQLNFESSEFADGTGRKLPMYRITRDGFTLLAMGFTGKEATAWKVAYLRTFNKMESELLGRAEAAPYSVAPHQALSAENAEALRMTLVDFAEKLPKDKRPAFLRVGWSKLKSHFKVTYRQIPNSQFADAMSIVARHIVEHAPEHEPLIELEPGFIKADQAMKARKIVSALNLALESFPIRALTWEGQIIMSGYQDISRRARESLA